MEITQTDLRPLATKKRPASNLNSGQKYLFKKPRAMIF